MSDPGMLARLVAQAEDAGGDLITLRAIIEEASDLGAARALSRLGLADDDAHGDVRELRELLGAWRDTKAGLWKAALEWFVRVTTVLILIGLAVRLGLWQLVK